MKYSFPKQNPIIISLGGSIFSTPDGPDITYLKQFTSAIRSYVDEGYHFVIITGGGKLCRIYQDTAKQLTTPSNDDLDWIGIASTKLNAQLVRVLLADIAHPEVIEDPTQPPLLNHPVAIGSGYRPGNSSDHDAVLLAVHYGASALINLGTADHVYSADPRTNTTAEKYTDLSWEQYLQIIPDKWSPGMNAPFDPVAAKDAQVHGLSVLITSGADLANFDAIIRGQEANGTLIHP